MNYVSGPELEAAGKQVEELVPRYYIQQLDPSEALSTGVGNCFAKAMIACGVLVVNHQIEPSVAYSLRLHGTEKPAAKPLDFKTKKNMAHIAVVVANSRGANPFDVLALDYGVEVTGVDADNMGYSSKDRAKVEAYNKHETFIEITDGHGNLGATVVSQELGLGVLDWRDGAELYLARLEREMFSIDDLLAQIADPARSSAA